MILQMGQPTQTNTHAILEDVSQHAQQSIISQELNPRQQILNILHGLEQHLRQVKQEQL